MISDKVKRKIIESLRNSIKLCAEEGYVKSQQRCPVLTGAMRHSGYVRHYDYAERKQSIVGYKKDYSSFVERGWRGGIIHVRDYVRKDGVLVREHSYYKKPYDGRHFIENSLKDSFSDFKERFDRNMRVRFENVRRGL